MVPLLHNSPQIYSYTMDVRILFNRLLAELPAILPIPQVLTYGTVQLYFHIITHYYACSHMATRKELLSPTPCGCTYHGHGIVTRVHAWLAN